MSDGQLIGGAVGAAVGFVATGGNPGGALKGAAYGASIGGALDPPPGPDLVGPRLDDTRAQTSTYGSGIASLDGTQGISGTVCWVENGKIKETRVEEDAGGKGGSSQTSVTFKYTATFMVLLTDHQIKGIGRLWLLSDLVANTLTEDFETAIATGEVYPTFALQSDTGLLKASLDQNPTGGTVRLYPGYDDQPQDPRMVADLGVDKCPAYRGRSYLMFYDWPLDDFNNSLAGLQVKAEVIADSGDNSAVLLSKQTIPLPNDNDCYARYLTPETVVFEQWNGVDAYRSWEVGIDHYFSFVQPVGSGNNNAAGVTDVPIFPIDESYFPSPFEVANYPSGDIVVKNGVYYGVRYSSDRIYRESQYVEPGFQVHSIAVDDSGNLYGVGENTVKIYDEDLTEIASISFNISGQSYHGDNVRVRWDNGFLYFCFGLNFINSIYIAPDDLSYVSEKISLPSLGGAIDNEAQINISRGIATRFGKDNNLDEAYVERYKLPAIGLDGPSLESVVRRRSEKSQLIQPGDLDLTALASDVVDGYTTVGLHSIRSQIAPLRSAYGFDLINSGYQLKAVKRGGSSVMTIDWDDLDARPFGSSPGTALPFTREMDSQLPRKMIVNFVDSGRNYNNNSEPSHERISSEAVNIEDYEIPLVLTPDHAANIAQTEFERRWLERYDFPLWKLPQTYQALEPADAVTLLTPWATYEFRITQINYLADGRLEISSKLNGPALYNPNAEGGTTIQGDTTIAFAGTSVLHLLDIPLIRDADNVPGFGGAVSGRTAGWPGGVIARSVDSGQTWKSIQGYANPVTMGVCRDPLGEHDGLTIDRTSELTIDFYSSSMSISSITEAQMMTGKNWFAYGAHGRWEIGRLVNAVTNSDGSATVSTLARGLQNSARYSGLHEVGDVFVFLSDADAAFMAANVSDIGVERLYRAITQGKGINSATDNSFIYTGENLKPYNLVNLGGSKSGDDWVFTADRRSRLSDNWLVTGVEPPVGETTEAYEWDIISEGSAVRTLTSSSPTVTYTGAQQTEDFSLLKTSVGYRVYQMSDTVGRGYPAETVVSEGPILADNHPDLIAFYDFNDITSGSLIDRSTNGNDAVLAGSPPQEAGHLASAVVFEGSPDSANIGGILPNDDFAVSFWMKVSSAPGTADIIVSRGASGESQATNINWLEIRGDTGNFGAFTETGGGTNHSYDFGSGPDYDGSFHHYIYQLDGGDASIYKDGALLAGPTAITVSDTTSTSGRIGRKPDASSNYLHASLDQMRIFDRVLSASEITELAGE